jgi:hypothetical protein
LHKRRDPLNKCRDPLNFVIQKSDLKNFDNWNAVLLLIRPDIHLVTSLETRRVVSMEERGLETRLESRID